MPKEPPISSHKEQFARAEFCVLIFVCNNDIALEQTMSDVLPYIENHMVINENPTENMNLSKYPHSIQYKSNKGEHYTWGLKHAAAQNYEYTIAMCSDGPHFAANLSSLAALVPAIPSARVIDAPNMDHEIVPDKIKARIVPVLFKKANWQQFWSMTFVNPEESNRTKAASIGFGIFMGIMPIYGLQIAIGLPIAVLFRLNKGLFLIACNVSIFPILPFILLASVMTGDVLLGSKTDINSLHHLTLKNVYEFGSAFFVGGTMLAITAAAAAYLLSYVLFFIFRRDR